MRSYDVAYGLGDSCRIVGHTQDQEMDIRPYQFLQGSTAQLLGPQHSIAPLRGYVQI